MSGGRTTVLPVAAAVGAAALVGYGLYGLYESICTHVAPRVTEAMAPAGGILVPLLLNWPIACVWGLLLRALRLRTHPLLVASVATPAIYYASFGYLWNGELLAMADAGGDVALCGVAYVLLLIVVPSVLLMWGVMRVGRTVARVVPICVRCGYDLTGNVSGRCPECGLPRDACKPRFRKEYR